MRLTQEWPHRPGDVDLCFRASLRPQLDLWLVVWFGSFVFKGLNILKISKGLT